MSNNYTYVIWFFSIWMTLQLNQCSQHQANQDIIKELREINKEIKSK